MTKARDISDLLDANGDVKSTALDNVPASNDASALTTGTIDNARISLDVNEIPNLDTSKITTGTFADARMPSTVLNSNVDLTNLSASNLTSGTLPDARFPTTLPAVSGANLTNLPGGGNTVLLGDTNVTTPVASVAFSNIFDDSTYAYYKIMVESLQSMFVTNGGSNNSWCSPYMYYTDSSGNDVTLDPSLGVGVRIARDYSGGGSALSNTAYYNGYVGEYSYSKVINEIHNGSDEGTGIYMMGYLHNPENTTIYKQFNYESTTQKSVSLDGSRLFNIRYSHSFDCSTAIKGVKFTDSIQGVIRSGRIRIWGIKH